MAYAIMENGRLNLIVITAEEAAKRGDVITVPDGTRTGQTMDKDGKIIDHPDGEKKTHLAEPEMLALYELAKTSTQAEFYRDLIIAGSKITPEMKNFFDEEGVIQ